MKIYLSPSNQPANKYVVGNTNEKVQMEAVAARVKVVLDRDYNCESIMATLSMGIGAGERPQEAKTKSCDFYLAIHSNATGGTPPCTATGAIGFYHPDSAKAKTLMTAMVNELNAICPVKSNRAASVASGMTQFNGAGYGEIRSPMQKGVPSALIEVNFHDNPSTAQWIIDNKDAIAAAIVKSIVSTFGITKKSGTAPAPVTPAAPPPVASMDVTDGAVVAFKLGTKSYYPGGAAVPAWVITDYTHRVTQVALGGKPVVKGGKACVLLGKKINKKTGKEEAGINTWVDQEVLSIVGAASPPAAPAAPVFAAYTVKVTTNPLNIRKGPGTDTAVVGAIKDKGVYTIVDEATGSGATRWGKLKSGAGWISLDYTKK